MPAPTDTAALGPIGAVADPALVEGKFDLLFAYLQAGVDTYAAASIANAALAVGAVAYNKLATMPACRVYHNAAQSIAHGVVTTLAFNSERHDSDTMHDPVTNNSRITIQKSGLYLVELEVQWAVGTQQRRRMAQITAQALSGSGGTFIALARDDKGSEDSSGNAAHSLATVHRFTATDILIAQVYQESAASAALNVAASDVATSRIGCEFGATYLSA